MGGQFVPHQPIYSLDNYPSSNDNVRTLWGLLFLIVNRSQPHLFFACIMFFSEPWCDHILHATSIQIKYIYIFPETTKNILLSGSLVRHSGHMYTKLACQSAHGREMYWLQQKGSLRYQSYCTRWSRIYSTYYVKGWRRSRFYDTLRDAPPPWGDVTNSMQSA